MAIEIKKSDLLKELQRKRIENMIGNNIVIERNVKLPGGVNLPSLILDGVEIVHSGFEVDFRPGHLPVITVKLIPKSLVLVQPVEEEGS